MSFLEDSWEQREEQVYPSLFGNTTNQLYPLDPSLFKNQFNRDSVDPTWLHYGVMVCPPNDTRSTWL